METKNGEHAVSLMAPDAGTMDVWELYDLDAGREVPCTSLRTFLYLASSPGATKATIYAATVSGVPRFKAEVTGPVAEDGAPLKASYLIQKPETEDALTDVERGTLAERLRVLKDVPELNEVVKTVLGV